MKKREDGKRKSRTTWHKRYFVALICAIVFVTTYALVLPAVTLDEETASQEPGIVLPIASDDPIGEDDDPVTGEDSNTQDPENQEPANQGLSDDPDLPGDGENNLPENPGEETNTPDPTDQEPVNQEPANQNPPADSDLPDDGEKPAGPSDADSAPISPADLYDDEMPDPDEEEPVEDNKPVEKVTLAKWLNFDTPDACLVTIGEIPEGTELRLSAPEEWTYAQAIAPWFEPAYHTLLAIRIDLGDVTLNEAVPVSVHYAALEGLDANQLPSLFRIRDDGAAEPVSYLYTDYDASINFHTDEFGIYVLAEAADEQDVVADEEASAIDETDAAAEPETEPESEPAAEQVDYPAQSFHAEAAPEFWDNVIVDVEAPEGAFPADTRMEVTPVREQNVFDAAASAVQENVTVVVVVDISFFDADGNEVEPLLPIRVTLTSAVIEQENDTVLVHVSDDLDAAQVDSEQMIPAPGGAQLAFRGNEFSMYAIVGTEVITVDYLTTDGETYRVDVEIPEGANIPSGAGLQIRELTEEESAEYLAQAAEAIGVKVDDLQYVKLLDISIVKNGEKIQPEVPVGVSISLLDLEDEIAAHVVHFADEESIEELEVTAEGSDVSFAADSFSVYAIIGTKPIVIDFLTADGRTLTVTVTFDENEVLPKEAKLEVKEITEADVNWGDRSSRFAGVLSKEYGNVTISDVRFLEISILVDGEKYEPQNPVEVKIEYRDPLITENTVEYYYDEEDDPNAPLPELDNRFVMVHYTDNGAVLLESDIEQGTWGIVETITMTDSFSDYDTAYVYDYDTYEAGTDSRISNGMSFGALTADDIGVRLLAAGDDNVMLASAGDTPEHAKTLANNGDGTYTIGLSVTGDADTTKQVSPVNVVIVYDVSLSMTGNRIPMALGSYGLDASGGGSGATDGTYFQLYRRNGNSYSAISDGYDGTDTLYRQTTSRGQTSYTEYTGQRYSSNIYRADAAEKVLYDFVDGLAAYQTGDGSNVQVALVTFSGSATTNTNWTTNLTGNNGLTSKLSSTGSAGSHKLGYSQGTNWEAALSQAITVVNSADSDPTYVVFVTDGAPSRSNSGGSSTSGYYLAATDEARTVYNTVANKGGKFFGIYAYGKETDYLASLMYYAYSGSRPASSIEGTTFDTEGYYNASSQEALEQAIAAIFNDIVDTMGVGSATISDGTTSNVSTSSGEIADLLDVNTDSFQYWLSWPVTASGSGYTFTMPDKTTGNDVTYTVTLSGSTATITWDGGSATYSNASISSGSVLTVEWASGTGFYNFAPPAASFQDPSVDWDLSSLGTLLDGVTYQVTFEVYPTQYTLDLIADLKNGFVTYDSLDENVRKYLTQSGDDYVLATNTAASLTYTDSRTEDGEQTSEYTNPDPVGAAATKSIALSKDWSNILDSRTKPESLTMHVTRDGTDRYEIILDDSNSWTSDAWISFGIMTVKDGTVTVKASGHDYSFSEPDDMTYYWELDVPTMRPMLINSVETLLVKVDASEAPDMSGDNATATSGGVTYYKLTIDGTTEYYKVDNAAATLTAINNRRSYLDVVKTVTEANAPREDFTFSMTIHNANPVKECGL